MPVSGQFCSGTEPKLYSLSERASTLILSEVPSISWNFMNVNEVSVLASFGRFFIWIGGKANKEKKFMALKFDKLIKRRPGYKKTVWVLDGLENDLNTEDRETFQKYLPPDSKMVKMDAPCEDVSLNQTKTRKMTKLYNVMEGEEDSKIIAHVKNGPLEQSDLNGMVTCIINHVQNMVWIWVSKRASEEERSRAINVGVGYQGKKCEPASFQSFNVTVARAIEGEEPAEFKMLFRRWIDTLHANGQLYFSKKVSGCVNSLINAEQLENSPFMAAETQLFDYGGGVMKICKVIGDKLQPLSAEEYGIFHCSYSYLVCYTYKVYGEERKILYYWLGSDAPQNEKESCIWPSLVDIPDLRNAIARVRIEQFHETPHFHQIFQGKIIVLTRHVAQLLGSAKPALDEYQTLLLKVVGGDACNCLSLEVEPVASSLSSDSVFILRTRKANYVWCGLSSKGDEREMAKRIANRWASHYSVLLEGGETSDFWQALGGRQNYSTQKPETKAEVSVPPRAFKCSLADGNLRVSEINNFEKSDFGLCNTIVLDAWRVIYVWTGGAVPQEDKLRSEEVAFEYLKTDPCGRCLSIPIIQVYGGQEPPAFRGFFKSWKFDLDSEFIFDDEYVEYVESVPPQCAVEPLPSQLNVEENKVEVKVACVDVIDKKTFPPEQLQWKGVDELPTSIDTENREKHLTDEDFLRVFGISREMFKKQPAWKQKNMKKSVGLF
ncbi:UNVERIFIED_CONTAM: hypothetical protein PYX00_006097 [Menopon gallinae]